MIANVSSNDNNTIGKDGTNLAENAAAAVHARAQSELAKAAEEAQKLLQELDHGATQNERVKIHVFDFSDTGAYLSKGSGDKMRARKIYQELYDKVGTTGSWKITDIVPARASTLGHTNKVIGFWHAFVESNVTGEKVDMRQVVDEMRTSNCDDLAVAQVCYPEMPGAYCVVAIEDNIGIGAKINEMQKSGCAPTSTSSKPRPTCSTSIVALRRGRRARRRSKGTSARRRGGGANGRRGLGCGGEASDARDERPCV